MKPPRLARALLARAVPRDAAGASVIGDLQQEFDERRLARGALTSRAWYWRQAVSIWWWSSWRHPSDSHHQPAGGLMFDWVSDLGHALRAARNARGQTALVVGTLALAIGATTIGFSFADLAVLRGLPVDDPDRVVFLFAVDPRNGNDRSHVALADFVEYKERSHTTERLAAFESGRATLIERGQASVLDVGRATADFFAAMGQTPRLGRFFLAGEDRPDAPGVAVLSYSYWTDVMQSDPGVLGRTLQLGRDPHVIVGVAGPDMGFGSMAIIDAWIPLRVTSAEQRPGRRVRVIGRLRPGVDLATAAAEFATIGDGLASQHPETNAGWRARLAHISEATGGRNFWLVIALFVMAVGLVLAVACANVANLLLVRAAARSREMALRSALGASRTRLVRQLLFEGVLLAIAAGLLAIPLAEALLRVIRSFDSEPALQQLWFDVHEFAFVAAVVLVSPMIFALAPAVTLSRTDVRSALASGGPRAVSGGRVGRSLLVVMQIALAVVLVSTAGLAVRTAVNIGRTDIGIQTASALKFEIELDAQQYPDAERVPVVLNDLRDRLSRLAGVRAIGTFDRLPVIGGQSTVTLALEGVEPSPDGVRPWALAGAAWADSLAIVGVSLVDGRTFTEHESAGTATVALLSRDAAVRYYGSSAAAIGRRITVSLPGGDTVREIVGVVTDVTSGDLELGPQPYVWLPLHATRRVGFVVVGETRTGSLPTDIRRVVAEVAPTTPLEALERYDTAVKRLWSSDVVIIGVLTFFALLALFLAATGLYGVVAYSASQRRAEFGTRIALGATSRDLLVMVFAQAFRLLGAGLAIGLTAGLFVGQAMRGALFGVDPLDSGNLAIVVALLAATAVIAGIIPAIRASRTDLVQALRAE